MNEINATNGKLHLNQNMYSRKRERKALFGNDTSTEKVVFLKEFHVEFYFAHLHARLK